MNITNIGSWPTTRSMTREPDAKGHFSRKKEEKLHVHICLVNACRAKDMKLVERK